MKIQQDTDVLSYLLRQVLEKTGLDRAHFTLRAEKDALGLYQNAERLASFVRPVRAGAIASYILRRAARPPTETLPDSIAIGPYVFHPRRAMLAREGRGDMPLTDKERDILAALWSAPARALDRDALLKNVWAYAEGVETHTLETHIYRLRRKLEDDPANPQWLVNRDGLYQLLT